MIKDDVIIILYDEDNRILLQFRGPKAPNVQNKWSFFGGGIEINETPEKAAEREALEELNYTLTNPKLVHVIDYDFGYKKGKKYCFIEKYNSSKILSLGEGDGMKWFSLKEIESMDNLQDICRKVIDNIIGRCFIGKRMGHSVYFIFCNYKYNKLCNGCGLYKTIRFWKLPVTA